jgi:prevent-host-death family protein
MKGTISIGELRQNPTRMLREVKAGATYTITDHGEPVAEVAGLHGPRWVSGVEVDELLKELGADDAWARDVAADRAAESPIDPWVRVE